ncbi:phage major tail protein, TP901-1 family [Salimicrobium jeotgali]|uniref:phage major tail protein, TP901-1 family n=1 Tax=Salimicrobium jeotgali TaxID=1230341 RepID=UPI000C85A62B|nr:phage major tail protein, TP901-1 family [Salimicrobium jeotgali]
MATSGKDIHTFIQPVGATNGALIIKNETENTHSIENELMDEQTKLGRILEYGNNTESFETTAYGEKNDEGQMALINAIKKKEKLDVWRVNTSGEGPYPATYGRVLVESAEKTGASDSFEEVTATMQVEGETVDDELTALPDAFSTASTITFKQPDTTGTGGV